MGGAILPGGAGTVKVLAPDADVMATVPPSPGDGAGGSRVRGAGEVAWPGASLRAVIVARKVGTGIVGEAMW